jgi:regulator of protease activity HflC (stomatin/prohibitin superfamily)
MNNTIKIISGIIAFFGIFIALILCFGSWGTIDTGHRGVVLSMGAVTGEIKGEGFYTKTPWIETVQEMDIRQQKQEVTTEGASKDLQTVHAIIALNLSVMPLKCAEIYQTIGRDYMSKIVEPTMQECIKAVLAQYTAEELISKRELVRDSIAKHISDKLDAIGFRSDALNIVDFDFSKSFNEAIEAKVTAEQNALASKNLLEQKKYEAQQLIEMAKGKAESMQIESAALAKNPQVLQLRALEKWDGVLPKVSSGVIPFIDVTSLTNNN